MIPLPAGAAAACRRRLHARVGARGRAPRRAPRRACARRSTPLRPHLERPGRASGGRTPTPTASPSASPSGSTKTCVCVYGAGPTAAVATPLEDADQRERQGPRVRRRAARGRPQRDRRLGGRVRASAASRRCSSRTSTSTRACGQRIELTAAPDRAAGGRRRCASRAAGDNPVERLLSLVLLGDLVSALPRRPARTSIHHPVEVIERLKSELAREPGSLARPPYTSPLARCGALLARRRFAHC